MGCSWWCIYTSTKICHIDKIIFIINLLLVLFLFFLLPWLLGEFHVHDSPTHPLPHCCSPPDLAEQTFVMKSPALLWSSARAGSRRKVPMATRDLSAVKQEVPLNPCVNGFDPWTLSPTASQSDTYPSVKPCRLQRAAARRRQSARRWHMSIRWPPHTWKLWQGWCLTSSHIVKTVCQPATEFLP